VKVEAVAAKVKPSAAIANLPLQNPTYSSSPPSTQKEGEAAPPTTQYLLLSLQHSLHLQVQFWLCIWRSGVVSCCCSGNGWLRSLNCLDM
jgi:hypothetical protein